MTQTEKLSTIVKALDGKGAIDIKVIKIGDLTIIADYFVIAHGTSTTHTRGLADEVDFRMGEKGVSAARIEGFDGASWIAMDYGDIVVHVFYRDVREQYNLEKLWSDGEVVDTAQFL